MDEKKPDRFLDDLLDASLKRYSSVEPRPGLEERLLAGIRAEPPRALWPRWAWLPATAGVVALMVAGTLILSERREPAPAAQPLARTVGAPAPPAPAISPEGTRPAAPAEVAPRPSRRAPALRVALPRSEHFPLPAPLSEEEHLLLRYVQVTPKEQLLARESSQPLEPLRIEPVVIQPLPSGPSEAQQYPN